MTLATFNDLTNEVLNYGFNDGPQVNRARIQNWLNEAQHRVARQIEVPELQVALTLQLTAGTVQYNLPADFLRVQDVGFPSLATRLRPVDMQQFDMTNYQTVQGPPALYMIYGSQIWVFPNPDSAYQLTLRYIKNPPDMVNPTDTPVVVPNYLDLLVTYAVMRCFEAEDDYEAAQFWQTKWARELGQYATDVQDRLIDRPRQVDGTWTGGNYGARGVI